MNEFLTKVEVSRWLRIPMATLDYLVCSGKNPSLNFNNLNGRFFCHGCNKKGDIFHFFANLKELNTKTDFRKILNGVGGDFGLSTVQKKKSKLVQTYDYLNDQGKLLFQVCRMVEM